MLDIYSFMPVIICILCRKEREKLDITLDSMVIHASHHQLLIRCCMGSQLINYIYMKIYFKFSSKKIKWKTNQSIKINLIGCDTIVNLPSPLHTAFLFLLSKWLSQSPVYILVLLPSDPF